MFLKGTVANLKMVPITGACSGVPIPRKSSQKFSLSHIHTYGEEKTKELCEFFFSLSACKADMIHEGLGNFCTVCLGQRPTVRM